MKHQKNLCQLQLNLLQVVLLFKAYHQRGNKEILVNLQDHSWVMGRQRKQETNLLSFRIIL